MSSFELCLFVCAVISTAAANPYCSVTCGAEKHTMCTYPGAGPACGAGPSKTLSERAKDDILIEHNEFRSETALGKTQNLPSASNMMKMYWDDELEQIAQRWANQCTFGHDKCRSLLSNEQVGQNIYILFSNSYNEHPYDFNGWKDESKHATEALIDSFGSSQQTVGHFTQMVWADSDRLGCALSVYKDDKAEANELVVCNYAAAGNWQGRPVYLKGPPCNDCKCSRDFKGLCIRKGDPDIDGVTALSSGAVILVTTQLTLFYFKYNQS